MEQLISRIHGYGEQMAEMPFIGIPSFFRTNVVKTLEGIDIGLVGVATDAGLSHRPGARYGPQAIRTQSGLIRYINPITKVIPYDHARVADLGDVPIYNTLDLERINEEIFAYYEKVHAAGVIPLSAGGDHSISFPILRALGKERPLALIHFDSHHDTAPAMKGSKFHHGAPFRNAIEAGVIDPSRSIQIAIRDPYAELTEPFVREHGMRFVNMPEVEELGVAGVVALIRKTVGDTPAYLSFDIDALDPTAAPGTGTPVMGGLNMREAMRMIQGLSGLKLAGGDVVEVSPPFDPTGMTALAGAQILFEILCITAQSRTIDH
ncbi:MAG TPA: agmatinase [Chthoniobacteraceae bacterium]|nr:agmatinase [Chthoniobacteraceae bacterium]